MRQIVLLFLLAFIIGCGGESESTKVSKSVSVSTEKDTVTTPEDGGYGFEDLAENLGFQTYVWSEKKDGTYFGDPRAVTVLSMIGVL